MQKKSRILVTVVILAALIIVGTFLSYNFFRGNIGNEKTSTTIPLTTKMNMTNFNFLIINSLTDIIDISTIIHYRYSISANQYFDIIVNLLGNELINGTLTDVVKIYLNSTNIIDIYVFWIDKTSHFIIKANKGDANLTGKAAQTLWSSIEPTIIFPFKRFQEDLMNKLSNYVEMKSKENRSYFYTNLLVYKYTYTPLNITEGISSAEFWVSLVQNKQFVVYYHITYQDVDISYELLAIKFS